MRKQNNNDVWRAKCYSEKDLKNGWFWRKKTSIFPSWSLAHLCCVGLLSWLNVHHHSVAHGAKIVARKGGLERGDVWECCKPKRGELVGSITFVGVFCPISTLFCVIFAQEASVLQEDFSCHSGDNWANFCKCLTDIMGDKMVVGRLCYCGWK